MRKFLIYLFCGFYLLILLGILLHTSTNPTILGKYSPQYSLCLLLAIGLFFFYRKAVIFVFSETIINRQDGTVLKISPIQKILLYIIILLACFLVCEMILIIRQHNKDEHAIYSFHPFLQNTLNIKDSRLHINSHGFRADEITKAKPDGTYRIFVVGGSTVLCDKRPFDKTHVRILERLLQQHYQNKIKIEVLNAGNSWHTTEHSIIKYLFKIKDFDPDLIILWHAVNDLYRSFAPERLAHRKFQSDYSHFLGPIANIVFKHFKDHARSWPTIIRHSLLLDRIFILFEDRLYSDLRKSNKLKAIDISEFPSLKSFERNLNSLIQILKNDQVKLILATQPFLYHEKLSEAERVMIWFPEFFCIDENREYPNLKSMELGMNLFNSVTEKIAEIHHIPLVDLEAHVPKNRAFFYDDFHYTEKGNQLIAETLFEFIKNNKIIE
ncbi:MAG: SGNH/GDSL hydrolase family protein [Candidatus Hodarchaeota archaeon]